MKLKLAVYQDTKHPACQYALHCTDDIRDGSVRVTQIVEVNFPDLTEETISGFLQQHRLRRLLALQQQVEELRS